jgi:hypothetical protein
MPYKELFPYFSVFFRVLPWPIGFFIDDTPLASAIRAIPIPACLLAGHRLHLYVETGLQQE